MPNLEPKGDFVSGPPALVPDINAANVILNSKNPSLCQTVELRPLIQAPITDLYANLGGPQNDHLYTYLPSGPYHDLPSFTKLINEGLAKSPSFFPFAIFSSDPIHITNQSPRTETDKAATPVGIICLLNIVPSHRSVEIGHVLLASTLQRTTAATEAFYLLMKYAFEELGYLRVEWKCNNFNEPSKRAALRLGYTFEGIFRKHMVVKGRRRDTAWYSVIDDEWKGGVKGALEEWLSKENFDEEGKQVKKLEEIRQALGS